MYFKERLKELRKERKLSQIDLAKILNIDSSTYANWEQGRREPSILTLMKLAVILDTSIDWLFGLDNVESVLNNFEDLRQDISQEDIYDELTEDGLYYRTIENTAEVLEMSEKEIEQILIQFERLKQWKKRT